MILGIIIILGLLAIDQLSKYLIFFLMDENQMIPVIKDFFYIASKRNFGAAWSLFYGKQWFLILVSLVAIVIFAFLFKSVNFKEKKTRLYSISVSLMFAGTIGNFIDRLTGHGVIDFLKFIIFGYHFPVFNFADMCLVCGVVLFGLEILLIDSHNFFKEHPKEDNHDQGSN